MGKNYISKICSFDFIPLFPSISNYKNHEENKTQKTENFLLFWNYPYLLMSSITPKAVAGTIVSILIASLPIFVIWNPSTSFLGSTALQTFLSEICAGTGSWTKIPSIVGSPFSSCIFVTSSSSVVFVGSLRVWLVIPKKM